MTPSSEAALKVCWEVADPYLDGAFRPAQLFSAYLAGFTLAESFYLALPDLSWRGVVVGDPLVAPFRRTSLPDEVADPPRDHSGLPGFFASRRTARFVAEGASIEVAPLLTRAGWLLVTGNLDAARQALEKATELGVATLGAHQMLAELYQRTKENDKAIERYRVILSDSPNHVVALNNLAYLLMEQEEHVDEAFRHARRAFALANNDPAVADTLGWILHLKGNDPEALRYLRRAVAGMPDASGVRLHTAIVLGSLGQLERSNDQLERALQLDPSLRADPRVVALRQLLAGPDAPQVH